MRRVAIALFVISTAAIAAGQSASTQKGWLRTSVATWEEPDRTSVLSFLDAGRKSSDTLAASIATADKPSASKLLTADVLKEWVDVSQVLASLRKDEPGLQIEYRNQAFELRSTRSESEAPTSRVWYALVPPAPAIARNFISIVIAERDGRSGPVLAIESVGYPADVPTWLVRKDAPLEPPATTPRQ